MPRRRRNQQVQRIVLAGARLLGWLTDLGAILIMGYIIKSWPGNGGAVSAGLVGVSSSHFLGFCLSSPIAARATHSRSSLREVGLGEGSGKWLGEPCLVSNMTVIFRESS